MYRDLTERQHHILDGIAVAEPDAVVIGWAGPSSGVSGAPVIRFDDGETVQVARMGRLHKRIAQHAPNAA